jgi:putative cardiolipin synthase
VTLYSDDPAKGLGQAPDSDLLISRIAELEPAQRSFDLVSAYFIPGAAGTEVLTRLAGEGVRTRAMTNSLAATDVPVVHSAYINYREALIDAGVEVLELREAAGQRVERDLSTMIVGSASSLHAKTFAIDGETIFVGSFNFDPRSARLNTEMGLLIPSPRMAQGLARALDAPFPHYRVRRGVDGDLEWIETTEGGGETVHLIEPGSGAFERAMLRFMSWLPIEWML